MYKIDFNKPIKVHFMGIGGISMSGLARILLNNNFTVSGSDNTYSSIIEDLIKAGAHIMIGQKASNINENIDLIVYTAAIHDDNPEFIEAKRLNIPMLSRADFIGQLMNNYKTPIAVSGTHGKTTTTSMIAQILLENDMDPTISVGGILKSINGNIYVGNSDLFLTEACEYTNSFLKFSPKIGIILNIEEDHMDFFKDIDDIRSSFLEFAHRLPSKENGGTLIINGEINDANIFIKELDCNIITYGIDGDYDYSAKNITYDEFARPSYDLYVNGKFVTRIGLSVTGLHNVSNSLPAIALCSLLDIPINSIQKGLLTFTGTDRRFEYKGEVNGIKILDDYAHHPTEIIATLKTAKRYPHRDIWCVFQSHTYTRTKAFLNEFVDALKLADHVILPDIYPARETDTLGMSSQLLCDKLIENGVDAYYFPTFNEIEKFILKNCKKNDLVITMGAGNVVDISDSLTK